MAQAGNSSGNVDEAYSAIYKVEVRSGLVPQYRISHLSDEGNYKFLVVGQMPDESVRRLMRIVLKIKVAKVCVLRIGNEVNGGWLAEDVGETFGSRHSIQG